MKAEHTLRKHRPDSRYRRMVVTAMLGAITALLAFTPIGMIMLPPPLPAVTLVHIPVIIAALVEGPVVGVLVGLVFGVSSLIRAWESGMVGLTLFFRNPLVSVLPRLIVPLAAWGVSALFHRGAKRHLALEHLARFENLRTVGRAAQFEHMEIDNCLESALQCGGSTLG